MHLLSWSHPVMALHHTWLGAVHCVRLLVHPPFVMSRRVTLPCPVRGLFGGLRVHSALALSLHVVTSDHIQSGVAPYGCARPLSRRVVAPYHARSGLFGGAFVYACLCARPLSRRVVAPYHAWLGAPSTATDGTHLPLCCLVTPSYACTCPCQKHCQRRARNHG